MKAGATRASLSFVLAGFACICISACSSGPPYESPGRFIMDSTYAEIRIRDGSPGSSCYVFMAYHYEVLGGVIDMFCMSPAESPYGICYSADYFLGCYIPAGSRKIESYDWDFEETYEGIDTASVFIEIGGIMPTGRLDYCSYEYFSYSDTLRAPVRRGFEDGGQIPSIR